MKVLITGGAGFIGSHLVDGYRSRKDEVVIIDDLSSGSKNNIQDHLSNGVKLYQVSLQSPEVKDILKKENPDLINHHAAQKSVRDSVNFPMKDADINIMGFLNLLEAARETQCRKVIFASSGGAIYGEQDVFPASEDHPKRPLSPYGVSKYTSELYMDFYVKQWGFQCIALRYANVFGPRQDPEGEAGVVAIFCSRMKAGDSTTIYGSGRQARDFVYVADIVSVNLKVEGLFESKNFPGFSGLNVGTGVETSIITLHQKLSSVSKYQYAPKFEREKPGEQLRSSLSSAKLRDLTGWQPVTGLDLGLRRTYESFVEAK